MMKNKIIPNGFTIVELFIVIAIMGVLLLATSYQFSRWIRRYNIEKDIKQMQIDLLYAKKVAMNKNITHFFRVNTSDKKTYDVIEDRNRNEQLDLTDCSTNNDCTILSYTTKYDLSWSSLDVINFNSRGISNGNKTFCIFSNVSPAVDCIVISNTRINIGKIINQGGGCNESNCEPK